MNDVIAKKRGVTVSASVTNSVRLWLIARPAESGVPGVTNAPSAVLLIISVCKYQLHYTVAPENVDNTGGVMLTMYVLIWYSYIFLPKNISWSTYW